MSSIKIISLISLIIVLFLIYNCEGKNKYSKDANKPKTEFSQPTNIKGLREIDKPFRMHKLNLVWLKAKHRLTDPKLQSLFSDLKLHDKEEIEFKHAKADGKDESGLEEARLRKKLIGIMSTYDLLEHFEDVDPKLFKKPKPFKDASNYVAKDVFRDRRLNMLWAKAERGGFTQEELETLKEEFSHHQDKIDEYLSLLSEIEAKDPDTHKNSLHDKPENSNFVKQEEGMGNDIPGRKKDYLAKAKLLKEKHLGVRTGFDHLEGITAKGPNHKEFVDPKVQSLWRLAVEGKFPRAELESLKEELFHYETRLLKLRHLHTEAALEAARQGKNYQPNKTSDTQILQHTRHIEKLHKDLEAKIMQNHVEL